MFLGEFEGVSGGWEIWKTNWVGVWKSLVLDGWEIWIKWMNTWAEWMNVWVRWIQDEETSRQKAKKKVLGVTIRIWKWVKNRLKVGFEWEVKNGWKLGVELVKEGVKWSDGKRGFEIWCSEFGVQKEVYGWKRGLEKRLVMVRLMKMIKMKSVTIS